MYKISMNLSRLFIFCVAICILMPVTVSADEPPSPYAVDKLVMGKKTPEFTLKNMEGNPVSLSSYNDRVRLLFFWASWCPTSSQEFTSLNKLNSMFKDRGLVILAISTDKSLSAAKAFLVKNPGGFQTLHDERLYVSKTLYKAFMIPMAFLIDKKGVVVKKWFGQQSWAEPEIIKEITSMLGEDR
jgi:cytochrome c biogenesis protein CcmG/thiol:disulfide interchange protein DsbE